MRFGRDPGVTKSPYFVVSGNPCPDTAERTNSAVESEQTMARGT